MISVIVGTQNPQKLEAVRDAFNVFFGTDVSVRMHDVKSDVPKHPKDYDIMRGAENRIRKLKGLAKSKGDEYVVAVEDGIIHIGKRYYHMYYVMIENIKTGKKSTGMGQLLEIPSKHVSLVMKTSIENLFRVIFGNPQIDGVELLTLSEVQRKNLIYNGTVMALAGQINKGTW